MEQIWQKKILVNWKNYPVESSNLKNREIVEKKKEQNPRDHRDLGTIANLTFIWSEFQKKKKSKPEINCVILA